ncbi:MAG: T9SS type A sorting domain-containing protein, partial [Cytophagaceae bacterium]|nr:T9SS type A sorting domain-containing protein [Cytophagaceae bacterium]
SNPLPAAPRISAGGVTEFCQGDSVQLCSDSFLETGWNLTADRTKRTQAVKTGNFFATVTNGCVSPPSNSIFVDTRPLPSTPVIERVGAYTLEATGNVAGDDYNWQLGGQPISFRTQAIKVVSEGEYTVKTRLEYQVSAPVNRLACFSKPSPGFKFTFEPGDSGLSVYPNPSQGQVTIETKIDLMDATVTILTLDGRVIFSETISTFNARNRIDLITAPGLYLLQVQNEGFRQTKRIRIEPR